MSDMVERVARAIYHGTPRNKPFEQLAPNFQRYWEKRARAAIEAMSEPTEVMVEEGEGAHATYAAYQYPAVAETWEAMIDAALASGEREQGR